MAEEKMMRTDPRVRLGLLEEAERELLERLRKKEKEIQILLAELKTTHELVEEAAEEIEETDFEEKTAATQLVLEEQIQAMETIKQETSDQLKRLDSTAPLIDYQTSMKETLSTATAYNTVKRLYELAYETKWSQDDAKEFFSIANAISTVQKYEFNPIITQSVDTAYSALQAVSERQQTQISSNYDANAAPQFSPDSLATTVQKYDAPAAAPSTLESAIGRPAPSQFDNIDTNRLGQGLDLKKDYKPGTAGLAPEPIKGIGDQGNAIKEDYKPPVRVKKIKVK